MHLTKEQKKEIETLYYSGMPVYEIAFRLGIPEFYIRKVLKKNDWYLGKNYMSSFFFAIKTALYMRRLREK